MPADMNDYFKKKKPSGNNRSGNNQSGGGNFQNPMGNMGKGAPWIFIILAVAFGLFALKPFTIINSGEVGIKINTGKFEDTPLQPGLHFFVPVLQKIVPVNTRIRLITYSDISTGALGDGYRNYEGGLKRNPAITVLDRRGLTVNIDLAVQYRLRAETAPKTIEKWGTSWEPSDKDQRTDRTCADRQAGSDHCRADERESEAGSTTQGGDRTW